MPRKLGTGDRIPSFTLRSQDGGEIASADLLGKGPLVIFFYPKDDTPVCTAEACAFRDQYDVFKEAGAEVIGISADSEASHQSFADRHRLPFVLLSDPDNTVRKQFGAQQALGLIPGRVTYVVDAGGVIRHQFSSQLQAAKHVSEALEVVRSLAG
jgi:peroxiredoxin Q/BCP